MIKISLCYSLLFLAGSIVSNAYAETSVPVPPPLPLALPTIPAEASPAQADTTVTPAAVPLPTDAASTQSATEATPAQVDAKPAAAVPLPTDAASTQPATEATPAQADAKPAAVPLTGAETDAKTTPSTASVSADGKVPVSEAKPEAGWKGSLMFSATEMKALQEALESMGAEMENPKTANNSIASNARSFLSDISANLAPTFFLNTILYVSPDNWAVWVNGVKYSSQSPRFDNEALSGLHVESISAKSVRFKSKMRLLDRISPGWKDKFSVDSAGNFVENNTRNLVISQDKGSILFTLQPNQRLALSTMEISEGRMQ